MGRRLTARPTVVVVGGDGGVGKRIATGLAGRGFDVSVVATSVASAARPDAAVETDAATGPNAVTGAADPVTGPDGGAGTDAVTGPDAVTGADAAAGADAVESACALAAATGSFAAVVHAEVPAAALEPRPLVDVPDGEWDALADQPVRALLRTLQAAGRHLSAGGRIVVVVPTVALTGEAGLVGLATAGEAQRVLAKSAARSWGAAGITVNAVAASPAALAGAPPAGGANLDRAALPPPVPGGDEDVEDDVVAAVALLLEPAAARLTGATLTADGGVVMAP